MTITYEGVGFVGLLDIKYVIKIKIEMVLGRFFVICMEESLCGDLWNY